MKKEYNNKKVKSEEITNKQKVVPYSFPDGTVIQAESLEEATEKYNKKK